MPPTSTPPSLARRVATQARSIVTITAAWTVCVAVVLVVLRHALLTYGGR